MNLKRPDIQLFIVTTALVLVGLLLVGSAGQVLGAARGDALYYLKSQLWKLLPGVALMLLLWRLGAARLAKLAKPALLVGMGLLVLVLLQDFGAESSGARRWLSLGLFSFQPSEIVKLLLVLYLASRLARTTERLGEFKRGLLPPLLVVLAACALLLLQPDLSTALLLFVTALALFWIAGVPGKHLLLTLAVLIPLVVVLVYLEPYRWARVTAFLDPWADAEASGYQIVQSLLAIGSGGLSGVGLGASQQKLFYLPEAHTDFIFSILGEELGLLGGLAVLGLFVALVIIGLRIVKAARDPFSRLTALGVTVWLGLQALINIGVVTALLPTTGLPLPFISYGGSSLVVGLAAVGLLAGVARENLAGAPSKVGEPLPESRVRREPVASPAYSSRVERRSFERPRPRRSGGGRRGFGHSYNRPYGEIYARADRRRRWR
ncbi:MAG: putative lipid II flippase FtsW [Candidatus Coatesbacteria bacterium]|nr:putative lipid II flippase FtsW [Candidatus Coatesbacteria bacterium]